MKWRVVLLVCCSLIGAGELRAQNDSINSRRMDLVQQLHPGVLVRIQAGGPSTVGRLRSVTHDTVYLENGALARDDIKSVWIRQRATRKGVKLGALIGAPVGVAFGSFVVWLASVLGESGDDISAGELALGSVAFGTVGLVGGGAVGGIIGAGVPRWGEITDKHTSIPENPDAPIGSISITPAYAMMEQGDGGGVGARVTYTFETKYIDAGLEAGRYATGTTQQSLFVQCPQPGGFCQDTVDINTSVFHIGTVARVKVPTTKAVVPYASLGFGLYSWEFHESGTNVLGGYSIGAGVQLNNATNRRGVFAEARYQNNLTRSGGGRLSGFGFYTLGLGARLAW